MTRESRWLLMAILPAALVFAGCESQSGISKASPDSGVRDSARPDSATPGATTPDSASPDAVAPDSATPDVVAPDSATPDAATPDAARADAGSPDVATPGADSSDSALPGESSRDSGTSDWIRFNPDTGPFRLTDAKTDGEFVRAETGLPSPIDAGDSASSVPPEGTVRLTVNPASVDLGVIDVGSLSYPVTVTVSNAGTATSGPLNLNVSGIGITVIGCNQVILAPQATCQITIKAMQAVAGPFSGTVEVGDTVARTKSIAVTGLAMMPGSMLSLAPSSLYLGAVLAGETATGTIVMSNNTATNAIGIVIIVTGAGFTKSPTGTCTETLAVGQSCNIDVSFTASSAGPARGAVTVSVGGVSKIAALSATVQSPARLVMTPTTATLRTVVGTPSSPVTFYVANAGDVTSAIPLVTITGPGSPDFSRVSTCATGLPGGATASCQITVVYNPKTTVTNVSATLTVAEPGTGGSLVSAALTGTAVPPGTLVLTSSGVDLGTVIVGNTSTPSTVTLTNTGGEDTGAVTLGTTAPQFIIVTDACTGMDLGPKQACTFTVRFTPITGDMGVIAAQIKATAANTANPSFLGVSAVAVPTAKLAINPAALNFGTIPVSLESTAVTLTVANTGGTPTGALTVEQSGASFIIKGDTCAGASLTASGVTSSCQILVSFKPSAAGEATGSVTVSAPSSASTTTATLRGSGG